MSVDPHGSAILALSVAALVLGPIIHGLARRSRAASTGLDNFVLVAVVGLVALEILPHALELAGWPAFAALGLGLAGPAIAEGPMRLATRGTHRAALAMATLGMILHAFTDGLALASAHLAGHDSHGLEVAVIAHQLPVAVAVWWLLAPLGRAVAPAAMGLLAAATVAGFAFADASFARLDDAWIGAFQAIVGGLLLHVVTHRTQGPDQDRLAAATGGMVGIGLLALVGLDEHGSGAPFGRTLAALTDLLRASAPALLVAYLLTGVFQRLAADSPSRLGRAAAPEALVLRGVALALSRPRCSAEVASLYRDLLRRGVAPATAMAFLLTAPALGLDALLISLPLLGLTLTLASVASAVFVAWFVARWLGPRALAREDLTGDATALRGLRRSLTERVDATAPWITLGLLVAALVEPWLAPSALVGVPTFVQTLLCAALGAPIYLCASGVIPLLAVLLGKGLSPGAALALLLTGPVLSATTFRALRAEHGPPLSVRFIAAIFALAVALGTFIDLLWGAPAARALDADAGRFTDASSVILLALFLTSFVRQGPFRFITRIVDPTGARHAHAHAHEHAHEH